MRDVRRLTELSMPGELAKEVVRLINASGGGEIEALQSAVSSLDSRVTALEGESD